MNPPDNLTMSAVLIETDDAVLVVLSGAIDIVTVHRLLEVLIPLCVEAPAEVVVDLSAVEFLGLSGIAAIIDAAVRLDASGGITRLVGVSPLIERVLLTLGVSDLLALDVSE